MSVRGARCVVRRAACSVLGAVLSATCVVLGAQEAPKPFVRASLETKGPVAVGDRIDVSVDLYIPTWLTGPPQLPALDMDTAFSEVEGRAINSSETVHGQSMSVISYTYHVVPQAPGTLTIPPIALTFTYAIDARPSPPVTLKTAPLTVQVTLPPGAEALDYFFATSNLRLRQRFDRQPSKLAVGDAFTRTIELSATDAPGLALPPIDLTAPHGLRLSTEAPSLTTTPGERGELPVVTRVQRATYFTERKGHYVLPGLTVSYWNSARRAVATATLPEMAIDVAAAPAFTQEIALPPEPAETAPPETTLQKALRLARQWWRPGVVGLALVVVAVWAMRRFGPGLKRDWEASRQRQQESEARYFDDFERAARGGDVGRVHAAAMAWLARFEPLAQPRTVDHLACESGETPLTTVAARVDAVLFSARQSSATSGLAAEYAAAMARARRHVLDAAHARKPRPGALLPLNPS